MTLPQFVDKYVGYLRLNGITAIHEIQTVEQHRTAELTPVVDMDDSAYIIWKGTTSTLKQCIDVLYPMLETGDFSNALYEVQVIYGKAPHQSVPWDKFLNPPPPPAGPVSPIGAPIPAEEVAAKAEFGRVSVGRKYFAVNSDALAAGEGSIVTVDGKRYRAVAPVNPFSLWWMEL
jgi:hypothetical protein